jgi:hypothetical protein
MLKVVNDISGLVFSIENIKKPCFLYFLTKIELLHSEKIAKFLAI